MALPGSALGQAPLSPDKAFALTVTREADGDLAFAWDIAPGHYLYRDHTVASTPGGKASLPLELATGETKDDPGFGVVDVWHDEGRATLSAQTLTQVGGPTSVNITYQGCLEDSICYPPMTRTVDVPTRPQSEVAAREADAQTAQAAALLAIQAPGAAPTPALASDEGALAPPPVAPSPVTMFITPLGRPASRAISASASAVSGVYSAGFSTTVLPAASAGATFHASISSGKFHGMT